MQRIIVTRAEPGGEALAEVKEWLSITTSDDDVLLLGQLRAALDLCERFTGAVPLNQFCRETHPARHGLIRLRTAPVLSIVEVKEIDWTGAHIDLGPDSYRTDVLADGTGVVELLQTPRHSRLTIAFNTGLAARWRDLDPGLRQGIVRLAAHYYRERDHRELPEPPASVAALWRPWRRLRLT